jgi:hypothetical protein
MVWKKTTCVRHGTPSAARHTYARRGGCIERAPTASAHLRSRKACDAAFGRGAQVIAPCTFRKEGKSAAFPTAGDRCMRSCVGLKKSKGTKSGSATTSSRARASRRSRCVTTPPPSAFTHPPFQRQPPDRSRSRAIPLPPIAKVITLKKKKKNFTKQTCFVWCGGHRFWRPPPSPPLSSSLYARGYFSFLSLDRTPLFADVLLPPFLTRFDSPQVWVKSKKSRHCSARRR